MDLVFAFTVVVVVFQLEMNPGRRIALSVNLLGFTFELLKCVRHCHSVV